MNSSPYPLTSDDRYSRGDNNQNGFNSIRTSNSANRFLDFDLEEWVWAEERGRRRRWVWGNRLKVWETG